MLEVEVGTNEKKHGLALWCFLMLKEVKFVALPPEQPMHKIGTKYVCEY